MEKITPSMEKEKAISELLTGKGHWGTGQELLSQLVRLSTERVLQELLEKEQAEFIGSDRYERNEGKHGQRNGYKPGNLKTAEGLMQLKLPQIRGLTEPYRSELWQNLSTKSEVLEAIVTEMYSRGLSVRDVEETMVSATGAFVLSDTTVSKVTEKLYEQYEQFRKRDLSGYDVTYLLIDAVYESLRRYGCKQAILCCWGICSDGNRVLLHLKSGNSESYDEVMGFLRDMVSRGLNTPLAITTDGALGLTKAVEAMWPNSLRLRCWFHKMQNVSGKVPPDEWESFKSLITDVRDAPTYQKGEERLTSVIKNFETVFPEACRCLSDDMQASLNHLKLPIAHRIWVRTTNLVERSFVEERRRTKTIPHLWDEKSVVKLVFATLIRVSEKWKKRAFTSLEMAQIKTLKNQLKLDQKDTAKQTKKTNKRRSAGHVAA